MNASEQFKQHVQGQGKIVDGQGVTKQSGRSSNGVDACLPFAVAAPDAMTRSGQ